MGKGTSACHLLVLQITIWIQEFFFHLNPLNDKNKILQRVIEPLALAKFCALCFYLFIYLFRFFSVPEFCTLMSSTKWS